TGQERVGQPGPRSGGLRPRRVIGPADHHVADTLLELPHVAGPRVTGPQALADPPLGRRRQRLGLCLPRDAGREEAEQCRKLADGAGEGAPAVAEELGLDQRRGKSREIEREDTLAEVLGEALARALEGDMT